MLVLFYICLDMRMNALLGGWFTIRGQYYLPCIIGQMFWLLFSVKQLLPRKISNVVITWLPGTFILLNFYALFGVVAKRCFGELDFVSLCNKAAAFQPINSYMLMSLCMLLAVFSLMLLAKLCLPAPSQCAD